MANLAHAPVPHVGLRKPPQHRGLNVSRVNYEARWLIRKVLESRSVKEHFVVGFLNLLRYRARTEHTLEQRADIDGPRGQLADFLDNSGKPRSRPIRPDIQVLPVERQHARRDGTSRNAGDPIQLAEKTGLVEAPQCAEMKKHGPVAASRKAETDGIFQSRSWVAGADTHRRFRPERYVGIKKPHPISSPFPT